MPAISSSDLGVADAPLTDDGSDDCNGDYRDDDFGDRDDRDDRWVTLATFWTAAEAQLARLKLENEDVDCVILDENIVATDWLMANAVGGIKVQVREQDLDAAQLALQHGHDAPSTAPAKSSLASDMESCIEARCPECGSTNIGRPWVSRRTTWAGVVALMLSGVVVPLIPLTAGLFVVYLIRMRPWKCGDCGNESYAPAPPGGGFPVAPAPKESEC
jgi:hypothetical protein